MSRYYALVGREVVPTDGYALMPHIGDEKAGKYRVSTIFLSADYSNGYGPPQLFETMVFGRGPLDQEQERYSSLDAAEAGHKAWVEKCKAAARRK